jgi:hypothetical protein
MLHAVRLAGASDWRGNTSIYFYCQSALTSQVDEIIAYMPVNGGHSSLRSATCTKAAMTLIAQRIVDPPWGFAIGRGLGITRAFCEIDLVHALIAPHTKCPASHVFRKI